MEETSLESVLRSKLIKIYNLTTATNFIKHKSELDVVRRELKPTVDSIKIQISCLKQKFEYMKEQNNGIENLNQLLDTYNEKVSHMLENFPPSLNITAKDHKKFEQKNNANSVLVEQKFTPAKPDTVIDPTEFLPFQKDCKKTLFKDNEDSYQIELVNTIEFSKIPKYMIGRHTLTHINDFITTINQIIKSKYSLLSLGKIGARKKGELDLYLHFKKEETDVYPNKERKYFFTGEDYYRETKTKLDKMKLNNLTILRHCKRIKEVRIGKVVIYELITN
ncbi:Similar to SKA1: Spindle and kinetochore-associated protein 1 (Bos taurus) [Cotesia congregata]|uniref:SKA complex subunit 1 n=1 Tax=Cotesia congregata TaxID=51543 RepID=A0A8J2HPR8_COTCN|nr:Similar to SKA1: Spindle and kinetochore-associated protein 1 (Bos taurus) [Cotesia congregata]